MKIEKVTVRIAELRKTEDFENRRFELELTAKVEPEDCAQRVTEQLTENIRISIDEFFEEESTDIDELKAKVRKYKAKFGKL